MPICCLFFDRFLPLFSIKLHCFQNHFIIDLNPTMKEVSDVVPYELSHDRPEGPLFCLGPSVQTVYNVFVADIFLFFLLFAMISFGGLSCGHRGRGRRQFNVLLKLDQLSPRILTRRCVRPLRLVYLSS